MLFYILFKLQFDRCYKISLILNVLYAPFKCLI